MRNQLFEWVIKLVRNGCHPFPEKIKIKKKIIFQFTLPERQEDNRLDGSELKNWVERPEKVPGGIVEHV